MGLATHAMTEKHMAALLVELCKKGLIVHLPGSENYMYSAEMLATFKTNLERHCTSDGALISSLAESVVELYAGQNLSTEDIVQRVALLRSWIPALDFIR